MSDKNTMFSTESGGFCVQLGTSIQIHKNVLLKEEIRNFWQACEAAGADRAGWVKTIKNGSGDRVSQTIKPGAIFWAKNLLHPDRYHSRKRGTLFHPLGGHFQWDVVGLRRDGEFRPTVLTSRRRCHPAHPTWEPGGVHSCSPAFYHQSH